MRHFAKAILERAVTGYIRDEPKYNGMYGITDLDLIY